MSARDTVVEFDDATHTYRANGVVVPNVTRILEPLYDWTHVPQDVLDRKCELGRAVHLATEFDDKGTLDEASLSAEVSGYLEGWRRFRRETGFRPTLIEQPVYSGRLGVAGRLDRAGCFPAAADMVDVIDIKSGAEYDAHGVQVAGYALLYVHERDITTYPGRRAVYLHADGRYHMRRFIDVNDYATFAALVTLHNWRKRHEQ